MSWLRSWRRKRAFARLRRERPGWSDHDILVEQLTRELAHVLRVPRDLLETQVCGSAGVVDLEAEWNALPQERDRARAESVFIEYPPDPKTADEALRLGWWGSPAPRPVTCDVKVDEPDLDPGPWMPGTWADRREYENRIVELCHGDRDGECHWVKCPQLADGEPVRSGRHCPLDVDEDEDDWPDGRGGRI